MFGVSSNKCFQKAITKIWGALPGGAGDQSIATISQYLIIIHEQIYLKQIFFLFCIIISLILYIWYYSGKWYFVYILKIQSFWLKSEWPVAPSIESVFLWQSRRPYVRGGGHVEGVERWRGWWVERTCCFSGRPGFHQHDPRIKPAVKYLIMYFLTMIMISWSW